MNVEDRQKKLLIVAVVGIVLLVGNSVVFEPLKNGWNDRQKKIKELKENVEKDKKIVRQKEETLDRWEKMQASALPQDRSVAESKVFEALTRWEQQSRGIKIERRQPQWKDGDDYNTLELFIDATGSMNQVTAFLYSMEGDLSKLALRVEELDLISRDNNGNTLGLGLQLTGLVLNQQKDRQ